ncbi:hypothetical protein ACFFNY_14510 [Paenibacillus hodogayensis]|uniref:Copper amine oxidase N-terminal domain-containing protein n=1 Tax=Paenibacillus hodogayensis TaxID=279208 RepID=A0ABV5VWS1_9BACL
MKKFVIGFICGAAVAASTAVAASDAIQAHLFPSEVFIRSGETTIQPIEVDGENPVINYNGKAYIPLRTFAEAFGLHARFEEGNPDDGVKHRITLKKYDMPDDNNLYLTDPDNHVHMGQFYMSRQPNGQYVLTRGTIRIDKALDNKAISISALDVNGKPIGSSNFVYIDGSNAAPPQPGETRTFSTLIALNGREVDSYKVAVRDVMTPIQNEQVGMFLNDGVVAALFPSNGFDPKPRQGDTMPFHASFQNNYKKEIVLEPYAWSWSVYRMDDNGETGPLVLEQPLPAISGPLAGWASYSIPVNLDLKRDKDGQPLAPGRYRIVLNRPDTVGYRSEGSDLVTEKLLTNTRTPNGFGFELE